MTDVSRNPQEAAHDILAAEAFAVPAADPAFRRVTVLPDDPAGIAEPHDILAAEEFAMPAPGPVASPGSSGLSRHEGRSWAWAPVGGIVALWLWRRRR
jgi:hypothetical protein